MTELQAATAASRRAILSDLGASGEALEELFEYNSSPYRPTPSHRLPLSIEPCASDWADYAGEAATSGVLAALRPRLVQLNFPIQSGISAEPDYQAATRRGTFEVDEQALHMEQPEELELFLHESIAGPVPVLVTACRADFVSLVRALSARNEPIAVPNSMGACLVKGLTNWDRVQRYRVNWQSRQPFPPSEAMWQQELGTNLAPKKELYQDRFLILSRGPYSAVPSDEPDWLERSLQIRLDHECFHYLTLRLFGLIRSNALDEVLADLSGLLAAYERYDADRALAFLGIDSEGHARLRDGARLAIYRDQLSHRALEILTRLVAVVVERVASLLAELDHEVLATPAARAGLLLVLAESGLEALASSAGIQAAQERIEAVALEQKG